MRLNARIFDRVSGKDSCLAKWTDNFEPTIYNNQTCYPFLESPQTLRTLRQSAQFAGGSLTRKRPLLGVPRTTMNPTKRTVMTLLARAKNAQTMHTLRHTRHSAELAVVASALEQWVNKLDTYERNLRPKNRCKWRTLFWVEAELN